MYVWLTCLWSRDSVYSWRGSDCKYVGDQRSPSPLKVVNQSVDWHWSFSYCPNDKTISFDGFLSSNDQIIRCFVQGRSPCRSGCISVWRRFRVPELMWATCACLLAPWAGLAGCTAAQRAPSSGTSLPHVAWKQILSGMSTGGAF